MKYKVERVSTATVFSCRAKVRLGPEPLRALFARVCRPVAVARTQGAWYRRWRLVAVDGTVFDVPDTPANAQCFGRPGTSRGQGRSAYPQARAAALAECGTHAVFAAEGGPLSLHETALARRLFPALTKGMLVLADRGFCGFDLWRAAKAGGADLLWRVRSTVVLPVLEALADGSYLSEIVAARDHYRRADPERVRAIEYTLGPRGGDGAAYRLITTVLDPDHAPAEELAALYAQRWEIENTLDEIKNHQGIPGLVLRSRHETAPGPAGRSAQGGARARSCTSHSLCRSWWWRSASMSPATVPGAGATQCAGTGCARTCPLPTPRFSSSVRQIERPDPELWQSPAHEKPARVGQPPISGSVQRRAARCSSFPWQSACPCRWQLPSAVYAPNGMGAKFLAALAAAQIEPNCIRGRRWRAKRSPRPEATAAADPRSHDDMLTFGPRAQGQWNAGSDIAGKLVIKVGKSTGKKPSVASGFQALVKAERAGTQGQAVDLSPRPGHVVARSIGLGAGELEEVRP
ncbi:IS4 family transposase [Streptomyces sp. TG1A-8]|uniref:IS4 family transposase n=1 Tax=Streptomyces sp. TG1A-8 TaxID=3051385 RepID=UPI00265C731E|nr:IS4 family transposase [Streptomyces sp. TG1A-8]MDO0924067.1 IS4 family transposase [Streptomyces sp. TG1A-8]